MLVEMIDHAEMFKVGSQKPDINRSADFYEKVFGGRILSRGDSKGASGHIQIANTWLIVDVGAAHAGQADSNAQRTRPESHQQLYEFPRCRYSSVLSYRYS